MLNEIITKMAIRCYQSRRGEGRQPKPAQMKSLVSYILSELPTISHGIQVEGTWVDTVLYPASTSAIAAAGASVTIGDVWQMLADLRRSEACRAVFEELDAIAGRGPLPEGKLLRTVAIDATFTSSRPQHKSASTVDLTTAQSAESYSYSY